MKWTHPLLASSLLLAAMAPSAAAQSTAGGSDAVATVAATAPLMLPDGFDGAAPPTLPATVSRDTEHRTTVRVVKLTAPLRLDGNLDEELYRSVQPISDFIQMEPVAGAAATEKTEVWLSFDADNIYVSARLSESQPERMIANEMRRDNTTISQNENFQFSFDSFHSRRNSVVFSFNPIGGRMDGQVSSESQYNLDWNPLWRLEVRRQAGGWTAEAAIPFKSLRYTPGAAQLWGFQARRINRWKNEISYVTPLPEGTSRDGYLRVSEYATMVGLEVPRGGTRALDLKPYVTSNLATDLTASPTRRNELGKDLGFDAKYSLTQNLTVDLTYNTDFAQVEADEQQVNFTRFNLSFPEKRDFFLENQGLFQFAANNTSTAGRRDSGTSETPNLFYSRRIGLQNRQQIPLDLGARLSGRLGAYSLGVLNIKSGAVDEHGIASNNITVVRARRDLLRRSTIGMLYTRRAEAEQGGGAADTYGVDAGLAFYENLYMNLYWAQTKTPGAGDDDASYRGQIHYNADRWGLQAERLAVGRDFDPQVGFMRREDFHKDRASIRFSPRPRTHFQAVRRFNYQATVEYFTNPEDEFEGRERRFEFQAQFQSSDQIDAIYEEQRERIVEPFEVARGITIRPGDYKYGHAQVSFGFGQQRRVSGTWSVVAGNLYDGTRRGVGYEGRLKATQRLSLEPSIQINRLSLPAGAVTSKLISTRTTFTISPMIFVSGLVQYNSGIDAMSTNVRLRWEYQPGSELFLVYNDGRDTTGPRFATLRNRAIVFKINKLFRF